MGLTDTDGLVGKLEIIDRPRNLQWGKPLDFLKAIVSILRVRFPINRNNDFILKGWETPSTDDIGRLWGKLDQSSNPLGWHAFIKGKWRKFYDFAPGEVRWFIGNSDNPPDGWEPLVTVDTGVSSAIQAKAQSLSLESPIGSGTYIWYPARYVGYSE